jgi:tRNA (cmo5U34)-methyltransferase
MTSNRIQSIREAFDAVAREYDRTRRMFVPCFDELYAAAVDRIPFAHDDEFEVLDLGAGTGLLSAIVAETFPRSRITLADLAPAMLREARSRLRGARFSFVEIDYSAAPLSGRFDAVVSALSIHHLEHEQKRALFARIHQMLNGNGVFVNAEVVAEDSEDAELRTQERWRQAARTAGATEAELRGALERQKHDRCAAVGTQLSWLRSAGFSDVSCGFRDLIFAVYSGRK